MKARGPYGARCVPGETSSEKYPGFIMRPDGSYRKSKVWTNSKTGVQRSTSQGFVEKKCGACGADHLCLSGNVARQKTFSCSSECKRSLSLAEDGVKIKKKRQHGAGFHILVRARYHPNASRHGYVAEHRLVAEGMMGRYLRKGELVHHINMKKDDNRPENLSVCSGDTEHFLAHGSLNSCVQELLDMGVLCFSHEEKRYFVVSK